MNLIIFLLFGLVGAEKYLVADVYTDVENCASGYVGQALMPTGTCGNVPPLPNANQSIPFDSYKLSCSSQGDGTPPKIKVTGYRKDNCGGVGIPVPVPGLKSCDDGTVLSCSDSPSSVAKSWPAVGVYYPSKCTATPVAAVALVPDVCNSITKDDKKGSSKTTLSDGTIQLVGYSDLECSSAPLMSIDVSVGECAAVPPPPSLATVSQAIMPLTAVEGGVMHIFAKALARAVFSSILGSAGQGQETEASTPPPHSVNAHRMLEGTDMFYEGCVSSSIPGL